jgi:hypothetical protein
MSLRRSDGPADRAESERLLDSARHTRRATDPADPLARLLAAAAAPTNPGELSGEEQALAAFRAARADPVATPARAPRRRGIRTGTAAWVAGLAATATAGVAFAAAGLDRPAGPTAPAPTAPVGTSTAGSPTGGPDGTPTDAPGGVGTPTPSDARTGGAGPGRPAGVPQLTGLCHAYLAKPAGQRAKALEKTAFADLVAAAGGADRVEAYCRGLVPERSPHPTPDPRGARPTAPAAAPPTTAVPTAAAPTGRPTGGGHGG